MSWLDSAFAKREAIAVDCLGTQADAVDVEISIDDTWRGWADIQADGDDIRIAAADGRTGLSYKWAAFDYANKAGTIQISALQLPAPNCMAMVWLYWGSAAAASAAASFSVNAETLRTGRMETICGGRGIGTHTPMAQRPKASKPRATFTKSSAETIFVNWDLRGWLIPRCNTYQGSLRGEEIEFVRLAVLSSNVDQTALYNETKTRFFDPGIIRFEFTGGTSGTTYTISPTIGLTSGRVINPRALLRVDDTDET